MFTHVLGLKKARLAQLVERKALNLVVEGSSPSVGTDDSHSGATFFIFALSRCYFFYIWAGKLQGSLLVKLKLELFNTVVSLSRRFALRCYFCEPI